MLDQASTADEVPSSSVFTPNFTTTKQFYFTTNQVTGSFDIDLKCDSMVRCERRSRVAQPWVPSFNFITFRAGG